MNKVIRNVKTTIKTCFVLSLLSFNIGVYGDDTEVFFAENVAKPNLMFVLDASGSMRTQLPGTATGTPGATTVSIANGNQDSWQLDHNNTVNFGDAVINLSTANFGRFHFNVDVPRYAEITSARIQFQSTNTDTGDATFRTFVANVDNADVTQSARTVSAFRGPDWITNNRWDPGDRGADQLTPDLKDRVQLIVNRRGWQANNQMAFYLDPRNNNRRVAGFEHNTYQPAQLIISYITEGQNRMRAMQQSLRAVLENAPEDVNVNVGLMNFAQFGDDTEADERFRTYGVTGVAFPVTDLNSKARDVIVTQNDVHGLPGYPTENATIRDFIPDIADTWDPSGFTPIVDSLYEAALYMRGEKVHYGQTQPTRGGAHPSTYEGDTVSTNVLIDGRDRASAPTYKTPIVSSCQANYLVLMTDGQPANKIGNSNLLETQGALARRDVIPANQQGPQGPLADALPECVSPVGVGEAGRCGAELTHYLANNDNLPDPSTAFPDGQLDDQFIYTFTIGFDTDQITGDYLKSLATYDDPDTSAGADEDSFFEASSPQALAVAFQSILSIAGEPTGTLAAPGYSVNVRNGLEHEDDIYIPVFDRRNTSRWLGNLKKFKIVNVDGQRLIRGKNGQNVTDEAGNFTEQALDFWSDSTTADGGNVERGGLINKLDDPNARKIYTNLTGDSDVTLSDPENLLSIANIANISNADLGLTGSGDAAEDLEFRTKLVNFMRGWVDGDATSADRAPRYYMGDMLHSEPVVITYESGATEADRVQYIFAGTNEGYLHAFDTETGEEKFAFMPAEFLSTLPEALYLNAGTENDHAYGIDGSITADVIRDTNGDASQVIIYFGLRRGGNSFYALDVTDINNPKLLWKNGKAKTGPSSEPAFDSKGQSWSPIYIARVGKGSDRTPTEAVFVSGGYDEDEDRDLPDGSNDLDPSKIGDQIPVADFDEGNNLYIYRAGNGADAGDLLWSMPPSMRSQITNSIPGGLRPLDTNFNGLIDRVYFGDTGGNVWRLDLSETLEDGDTNSHLTKLASLGGTGVDNRMFFNEPDVSTLKLRGKNVFGIAIGSGYRSHPLENTIEDKFFYLIDDAPNRPLNPDVEFDTITIDDLQNINVTAANVVSQPDGTILDGGRGWILNLPEGGEKVLGSSLAIDGNILFSSLVPGVVTEGLIDLCAAPITQSKFYAFNVITGESGLDLNNDGDINDADINTKTVFEISGKPQVVFNPPEVTDVEDPITGDPTGERTCSHPVDIRTGKKVSQVSGYDACRLESIYWTDPVRQ